MVRWIVAPNSLHDRLLAEWQLAYPRAALLAPPGLGVRGPDCASTAILRKARGVLAGSDQVEVVFGKRITTEAVSFHVSSRTVLFADLIQQFGLGWFDDWRAIAARLDGLI